MLGRFLVAILAIGAIAPHARATHSELYSQAPFVGAPGDVFEDVERVGGNRCATGGDPVATPVGEFTQSGIDLLLGGGPLPLAFGRHFAGFVGQAANFWGFYVTPGSPMGINWVHNHQFLLKRLSATEVAVYYLRGKVIFFDKVGEVWQMVAAPVGFVYMGTPYQMVATGSKLEMMDPETRTILTFEFSSLPNGGVAPIERVRDRNGNTLTYTNNGDGTVATIADRAGNRPARDRPGHRGARTRSDSRKHPSAASSARCYSPHGRARTRTGTLWKGDARWETKAARKTRPRTRSRRRSRTTKRKNAKATSNRKRRNSEEPGEQGVGEV